MQTSPGETREVRRQRRRGAGFLAGAVVVGLLPATLVPFASGLRSPEQVMAAASEPPAALVTAPAERRILSETLAMRGRAVAPTSVQFVAAPAEGVDAVVTAAPKQVGEQVDHGDVVSVVSGRPVFVLEGSLPAYRDLRPGDRGVDVVQLNAALRAAGVESDEGDAYGRSTEAAVRALYERAGFEAPTTSADLAREQADADHQVGEAQRALEAAQAEVARGESELRVQAEAAAREAERARDAFEVTRLEAVAQVEVAEAQLEAARARLERVNEDAEAGDEQRDQARVEVVAAETALEVLRTRSATDVQQSEDELRAAAAAADRARRQSAGTDAVAAATAALARARSERARLIATSGALLPRAEVLFVPRMPAAVAALAATVGVAPPADGPLLTLSSGDLGAVALASPAQRALLDVGLSGVIRGAGQDDIEAVVDAIGEQPVQRDGVQGYEVTLDTPVPLSNEALGRTLEVRVVIQATARPVLAVPLVALSTRADGSATVLRATGDPAAPVTTVTVRAGLSAGGFVEVEPVAGRLREGDAVVVSR